MSSVNIPPPLVALLTAGALPSAVASPVINPPPSLAAVPPGTTLDATVLGRSAATGVITVQTAQGVFGFASPLVVAPGTALSLTVQGPPGQPQVVPAVVAPPPPQPQPVPQPPAAPIVSGAVVEAVLQTATPPAPLPAPLPQAAPFAASEIASTTPPPSTAASQAAPPAPAAPPVATPTTAQPTIGAAAVTPASNSTGAPTTPNPTTPGQAGSVPTAGPGAPTTGAPATNPFTPVSFTATPFDAASAEPLPPSLLAATTGASPAAVAAAARAALPTTGGAAVVAALISQEFAASNAAASAASAALTSGATTTSGTTTASTTGATPAALSGLPAGERLLLRVVSVTPPAEAEAAAAVEIADAAVAPAAATPPAAPGTVAATPTAANAAVAAPTSAAAQVQATAAPSIAVRPGQPTVAQEAITTLPAQAASASGAVTTAVVAPLLRGDGAGAFAPELPPQAASSAVAAQAAAAAEIASQTETAFGAGTAITPGAGQFTATVVGTTSSGQPVLLAGQSLLTLRGAPLAEGSQLVLQLAGAPASGVLASGLLDSTLRTSLPSLPELMTAAQQVGGPAQAALAAVVPQAGPALGGQIALFLSALQTGNLRSLIGESARTALERAGRGSTLSKVDGELKSASAALARSAAAGDWRSQGIPFNNGSAIVPIQLYVHQTKPDDDGNDPGQAGKTPTRFLLDLELSALGRVQLDALAQPPRFDLILRTPQALPEAIRNDLRLLFTDVTSARGLTGQVLFQVAPPIVPTGAASTVPRPGILV